MERSVTAALFRHGCIYEEKENGLGRFMAASLLDAGGVNHAFSTRKGGVSAPPFDSLNLTWSRAEARARIDENYRRYCGAFGFDYDSLAVINYAHGTGVAEVCAKDRGRGFALPPLPMVCDGLVTNDPGVTLVTSHADCGAIYLYDPEHHAIGLAHAGWKGTLGRIGAVVVREMNRLYGSRSEDLLAATGPCICKNCFEVDRTLAERFAQEFHCDGLYGPGKTAEKAQLDLQLAAALQLLDAGLREENITLMDVCTFEKEEYLYSYRRDKERSGSMAGFMALAK